MPKLWTPRRLAGRAQRSNDVAVANARAAATELARRRVERREAELFLRARGIDTAVRASSRPA